MLSYRPNERLKNMLLWRKLRNPYISLSNGKWNFLSWLKNVQNWNCYLDLEFANSLLFLLFFTIWSFPCPFEVAILTIKNPIYSINLLTKAMDYKVLSARFMGKSHHANVFVSVGNSTEVNACPLRRRPYSGFVSCLSIAKYETDKESGDQSETDLWPQTCCSPLWSPEKVMG